MGAYPPVIALDTETCLFGPANKAPPLVCVTIASDQGWQCLMHRDQAYLTVKELLTNKERQICGHSIAYDMIVIGNQWPDLLPLIFQAYRENRITCTETRAKLLDIADGGYYGYDRSGDGKFVKRTYSLDALARRFLGKSLDKDTWRLRYAELLPFPTDQWPEGAREYALEDARTTVALWTEQENRTSFLLDQYRQARADFWMHLMSAWGVHTDPNAVEILALRTQQDINALEADLQRETLIRSDGTKDTKVAKARIIAAYETMGEEIPITTTGLKKLKAGADETEIRRQYPSLDEDACDKSRDPVLRSYSEYSRKKGILSKDVPAFSTAWPLHTRFQPILETGRTSTSDPQLQNLSTGIDKKGQWHPGVRECLVPRPGMCFVSADYSGIELCTLAQVCIALLGSSTLADAINAGQDCHLKVAAQILGIPYEQADKELHYNQRQTGKVANFGFPGGLGAKALVDYAWGNYGVELVVEQAHALKHTWISTWPEMRDYFKYIDKVVTTEGGTWQLFSDRYRGKVRYTQACNTLFQGLAADIAKDAGFEIAQACYTDDSSALFGCRPVLFVHDEFVLEVPIDRCDAAAKTLEFVMLTSAARWLPNVKCKAEYHAADRYSKKPKQTQRDAQGRLVPCSIY